MGFLDRQVSDTQIKLRNRLWLYVISSIILFLLIVPSLIVIPMSFSDSQYLEFPLNNALGFGVFIIKLDKSVI